MPRIQPLDLEKETSKLKESLSEEKSSFSSSSKTSESSSKESSFFERFFASFPFGKGGKEKESNGVRAKEKTEELPFSLTEEESSLLMGVKKKSIFPKRKAFSRMILSLIFILGLGGLMIFFSKWWKRRYHFTTNHKQIHVLTQYYLDSKKRLVIVRVEGEHLLLGVTENSISLLKILSLLEEGSPLESEESFSNQFLKMENSNLSSSASSPSVNENSRPQNRTERGSSSSKSSSLSHEALQALSFPNTNFVENKGHQEKEDHLYRDSSFVNQEDLNLNKESSLEGLEKIKSFVEQKLRRKKRIR